MKKESLDIKIKELEYEKNEKRDQFGGTILVLEMSGKDIDHVIVNTLRRIIMDDIPSYAFAYVKIEHNNTIYDNDIMTVQLRQTPIYDIDSGILHLPEKYWLDVNYMDKDRDKYKEDKILIDMNINSYNNTNEIMRVTTDDADYIVNGKKMKYPARNKNEPPLLIELKPNDTFKCQLKGCLGVGEGDTIWSVAHSYYKIEDDTNNIIFSIESTGQLDEYVILDKACDIIMLKLTVIKDNVKKINMKNTKTIIFDLDNEDYTMGNLINNELQKHSEILFCGGTKPDFLVKSYRLKIMCSDKVDNPIKPIINAIDNLTKIFTKIKDLIR